LRPGATILPYGDTTRHPAMRHEVPLVVIDPFLFVDRDGEPLVLTSALEQARIAEARPDAHVELFDDFGLYDLVDAGTARHEAELEVLVRALREWGVEAALVPPDLPVAVADRVHAAGIELTVGRGAVDGRRRGKTDAELAGIRRAQRAARGRGRHGGDGAADPRRHGRGRAPGARRRDADRRDRPQRHPGGLCGAGRAGSSGDHRRVGALRRSHDPGSGPLPAGLPITVDLWPRDETSGCWADMTRTFVNGEIGADVAAIAAVVRGALEAARGAARPAITGEALYEVAAAVVEDGGFPTQRTREPGRRVTTGFWFALGHGVGLDVHEPPRLGLGGTEPLVRGDVLAIEPGIEGLEGIGGVRFEDLLLITEDGCETLTSYPYDL
jgi:Xaa-Pro aminopeptidase